MVVSFSYAYIKYETKEKNENIIGTECIKIEMEEVTNALNLYHAYPMKEATGSKTDAYQFKIRNACGVGVDYQVELEVENVEENKLPSQDIAVKLDTNNKITLTEDKKIKEKEQETYKIGTGTLKPYEEKSHEVRIWIDEDAGNESQNKIFKSKVVIEAVQNEIAIYSEPLLQGADPVLGKGMVAVEIGDNGIVTKADPTEKWYEYGKKKWANAVILNEGVEEPKVGDTINEDNIESYFVWIPKYSYKLFDEKLGEYTSLEETVQDKGPTTAIEIRFGLENTKDGNTNECTTPIESGGTGTCGVGKWMTHPAFLAFGGNGLWVGKFETSKKNTSDIQIKPDVTSWRNITLGESFGNSKNYQPELQSHLMKNTEWGAVAYLTQSIYGRCDKETGICTEVAINLTYTTGTTNNTSYTGGTNSNQLASTTGNYSGIYDLHGGAWEPVMAMMKGQNGEDYLYSLTKLSSADLKDTKYFDTYNYNASKNDYRNRILGDATGEDGPFYNDNSTNRGAMWSDRAVFPVASAPLFSRGGGKGSNGIIGVFTFGAHGGQALENSTFRIALAVQ